MSILKGRIDSFGERHLIEIIAQTIGESGYELFIDDASPIRMARNGGCIWVTSDPSPIPCYVHRIGMGDYFHSGWLLVVKSVSDIAAMGATPSGIVTALEFPPDLAIEDFIKFFKGMAACAKYHRCRLTGGNIRERAEGVHGVAFGIGTTKSTRVFRRGSARPGDVLIVLGSDNLGAFWAGVATHLFKKKCDMLQPAEKIKLRNASLLPSAALQAKGLMSKIGSIHFCMDNSDGLLGSLAELTRTSGHDSILNLNASTLDPVVLAVAKACHADPRVWALAWGSYHLLCAVAPKEVESLVSRSKRLRLNTAIVGVVGSKGGRILLGLNGRQYEFRDSSLLRGEQFYRESLWRQGLSAYANIMFKSRLEDLLLKS